MSADEIFDVVDTHDRVVATATRRDVHARGLLHRAVHILVEDQSGRIYLQLRSPAKDLYPNTWDTSAAGHVGTGEDYDGTAVRELEEELGITVRADGPQPHLLLKVAAHERTGWEFVQLYHLRHDGSVVPNPAEISDGGWFAAAEIDAWLARSPQDFAPAFAALWRIWQGRPEPDDPVVIH